jgi:hypothetical protein
MYYSIYKSHGRKTSIAPKQNLIRIVIMPLRISKIGSNILKPIRLLVNFKYNGEEGIAFAEKYLH